MRAKVILTMAAVMTLLVPSVARAVDIYGVLTSKSSVVQIDGVLWLLSGSPSRFWKCRAGYALRVRRDGPNQNRRSRPVEARSGSVPSEGHDRLLRRKAEAGRPALARKRPILKRRPSGRLCVGEHANCRSSLLPIPRSLRMPWRQFRPLGFRGLTFAV